MRCILVALAVIVSTITTFSQTSHAAVDMPSLIKTCAPSVVGIATESDLQIPGTSEKYKALVGSGFIVSPDGYVVTADHVVRALAANKLWIFRLGRTESANIVIEQTEHDLALLKMSGEKLPSLRWGKFSQVEAGQDILFMGHPIGDVHVTSIKGMIAFSDSGTLTVSNEPITGNYVALDAPVNSGNSGGPLVDVKTGNVIGIIEAKKGQISDYLQQLKRLADQLELRFLQDQFRWTSGPLYVMFRMRWTGTFS